MRLAPSPFLSRNECNTPPSPSEPSSMKAESRNNQKFGNMVGIDKSVIASEENLDVTMRVFDPAGTPLYFRESR